MDEIKKIEIRLDSEPNYVCVKVLAEGLAMSFDEMTSACRCALDAFESFALDLNAIKEKTDQKKRSKYHG